jgi:SAM-dependent methyltransferase
MAIDVSQLSKKLTLNDMGLWSTGSVNLPVSYPKEDHAYFANVEEVSFWFKHRNKIILSVLKAYPPRDWLLEVGAGNGFVASAIKKTGKVEIAVLEPGLVGGENSLKRGLAPVFNTTLEKAAFFDSSIPNLAMFDVLEHLEKDTAALQEVHRVLKPGGYFYLTVPALAFLWSSEDVRGGHYRRYSKTQLVKLLRGNGFTVRFSSYFFVPLVLPILLLRSLKERLFPSKNISEKLSKEHTGSHLSFAMPFLNYLFAREVKRIEKGKTCLWGSSLIVVAQVEK